MGQAAPAIEGWRPRLALLGAVAAVSGAAGAATSGITLAATAATAAGCSNGSNEQVVPPVDLGMTATMKPYYQDENLTIYQAQTPVPFPVKKPTAAIEQGLGKAPSGTPYPHAPYLTAGDEITEIHYTISNIDTQSHAVWLLVDPWNEFVRWAPGVTIVDEDDTTPNLGYDLAFVVPAKGRIQGTLTSDDLTEIATKLASVEKVLTSAQAKAAESADAAANYSGFDPSAIANNIFNSQNRSNGGDVLYTPWIPPVIAGVTGFDLGIRTNEPANVAVEITLDITDVNGNRFVTAGSGAAELGPPPVTLTIPGAMM